MIKNCPKFSPNRPLTSSNAVDRCAFFQFTKFAPYYIYSTRRFLLLQLMNNCRQTLEWPSFSRIKRRNWSNSSIKRRRRKRRKRKRKRKRRKRRRKEKRRRKREGGKTTNRKRNETGAQSQAPFIRRGGNSEHCFSFSCNPLRRSISSHLMPMRVLLNDKYTRASFYNSWLQPISSPMQFCTRQKINCGFVLFQAVSSVLKILFPEHKHHVNFFTLWIIQR